MRTRQAPKRERSEINYAALNDVRTYFRAFMEEKQESDEAVYEAIDSAQDELDDLREENARLRQRLGHRRGRVEEGTSTRESRHWDRVQARLNSVSEELSERENADRKFVEQFTEALDSLRNWARERRRRVA